MPKLRQNILIYFNDQDVHDAHREGLTKYAESCGGYDYYLKVDCFNNEIYYGKKGSMAVKELREWEGQYNYIVLLLNNWKAIKKILISHSEETNNAISTPIDSFKDEVEREIAFFVNGYCNNRWYMLFLIESVVCFLLSVFIAVVR